MWGTPKDSWMVYFMENPIYIIGIINNLIWVNFITTEPCSPSLEIIVYVREIIPIHGRTIQVSDILQFTQI